MTIRSGVALLLAACSLSACAGFGFLPDNEFSKADRFIQEKKYPEAIALYEKIAKDSSGSNRAADALFSSAKARASYDNPHKDYGASLQQFDEYIRRYPNNKRAPEAQQWRYLIKTIIDVKKENERLNQNIEQLKKIDIKHEERRRK